MKDGKSTGKVRRVVGECPKSCRKMSEEVSENIRRSVGKYPKKCRQEFQCVELLRRIRVEDGRESEDLRRNKCCVLREFGKSSSICVEWYYELNTLIEKAVTDKESKSKHREIYLNGVSLYSKIDQWFGKWFRIMIKNGEQWRSNPVKDRIRWKKIWSVSSAHVSRMRCDMRWNKILPKGKVQKVWEHRKSAKKCGIKEIKGNNRKYIIVCHS